jgi:hypothetical protein
MKVELDFEHKVCCVIREPEDPIFRNGGYAGNYGAEHRFFYWIKKALQKQGYDVIKKRIGTDGHLTDENMPYVRTRSHKRFDKHGNPEYWCVWNGDYQIRNSAQEFNKTGQVCLNIEIG